MSDEEDTSTLAPRAFAVYCDWFLRDTVEKNRALQQVNESLEPIWNALVSLRVSNPEAYRETLLQLNLQDYNDETEAHLVYDIEGAEIAFPHEYLRSFDMRVKISGVSTTTGSLLFERPTLSIRDGTVELLYTYNMFSVEGTLVNFAGTLEEVQNMIDSDHSYRLYFTLQELFGQTNHPLVGASFILRKIKIAKHIVQPTVTGTLDDNMPLVVDDIDTQILAQVDELNTALRKAIVQSDILENRNHKLKCAKALCQSVGVRYPGGSLTVKLEDGRLLRNIIDDEPVWTIDILSPPTIPLKHISKFNIFLINVPCSGPVGQRSVAPHFSADGYMLLGYGGGVFAVFTFDESLDDVDQGAPNFNLVDHVLNTLTSFREDPPGPYLTMKLVAIQLGLAVVQSHLDLLGIAFTTTDE